MISRSRDPDGPEGARIRPRSPAYDISEVLVDPPEIEDGSVLLPDRPGHGYEISSEARDQYEVDLTA